MTSNMPNNKRQRLTPAPTLADQGRGNTVSDVAGISLLEGVDTVSSAANGPPSMRELLSSKSLTLSVGPDQVAVTVQSILFRGTSMRLHELLTSPAVAQGDLAPVNQFLKSIDATAFSEMMRIAYAAAAKSDADPCTTRLAEPAGMVDKVYEMPACNKCKQNTNRLSFGCTPCHTTVMGKYRGLKAYFCGQTNHVWSEVKQQFLTEHNARGGPKLEKTDPRTGKEHNLIHFAKLFVSAEKADVPSLQITSFLMFIEKLQDYAQTQPTKTQLYDVLSFLSVAEQHTTSNPHLRVLQIKDLIKAVIRFVMCNAMLYAYSSDSTIRRLVGENKTFGVVMLEILGEMMVASDVPAVEHQLPASNRHLQLMP